MSTRISSTPTPVDVLAIGPHPDDVELGCGGTLAALARRGLAFGIADLTRGEMGTRGTPEARAREAARAAMILGARFRATLDLGDGAMRTDRAAELEIVALIRKSRPRLVLAPHREDRHPDHVRASRLVADAAWYAGLRRLQTGERAHRPQQVVYYPTSFTADPSFLVDVTEVFNQKLAAIRAYVSQFHDPASREPETYISTRGYFDGVTARAQAFGRLANVTFAEGFVSLQPPLLADPVAAFEGYEPGFPAIRKKAVRRQRNRP
jgi:N-acetylglucosamine malate deacetylase 1